MSQYAEAIAQLEASLTNHRPDPERVRLIEQLRDTAKALGAQIILSQPPSRERSLAVTKLEESVMWAVKGLVLPRGEGA